RALDDHARRVAAVGIFELVAHVLGIAQIELGADFPGPKRRHHLLVVSDAVAIEHSHHDGAEFGARIELAEERQRRLQRRHPDGKTRRRHRLAAEARDEAVVTAAAADRAEAHRAAFFILGVEQQFDLEDRAGVILEAADHGRIYPDPLFAIA